MLLLLLTQNDVTAFPLQIGSSHSKRKTKVSLTVPMMWWENPHPAFIRRHRAALTHRWNSSVQRHSSRRHNQSWTVQTAQLEMRKLLNIRKRSKSWGTDSRKPLIENNNNDIQDGESLLLLCAVCLYAVVIILSFLLLSTCKCGFLFQNSLN